LTLWEVITSAREGYVGAYRQAIRQQRKKLRDLQTELLVTPAGVEDVPEDFRSFRADMVWQQDGKPMAGALDAGDAGVGGMCDTEYPDGQRVGVLFLRWDDCEFHCTPAVGVNAALVGWLRTWADRSDANAPADPDGLRGIVHSATPPQRAPDRSTVAFAIDFGSAPPEAFTALIAAMFSCGVTSIQVGS
jgi:hypothetical protein